MRCGPRHGTWRPAMGGEHRPRLAGAGAAAACATNAECSRASCKTVTVWHDRTPTRFRPAGDDASVRSHDFPPPSSHRVPITYIMSPWLGRVLMHQMNQLGGTGGHPPIFLSDVRTNFVEAMGVSDLIEGRHAEYPCRSEVRPDRLAFFRLANRDVRGFRRNAATRSATVPRSGKWCLPMSIHLVGPTCRPFVDRRFTESHLGRAFALAIHRVRGDVGTSDADDAR